MTFAEALLGELISKRPPMPPHRYHHRRYHHKYHLTRTGITSTTTAPIKNRSRKGDSVRCHLSSASGIKNPIDFALLAVALSCLYYVGIWAATSVQACPSSRTAPARVRGRTYTHRSIEAEKAYLRVESEKYLALDQRGDETR